MRFPRTLVAYLTLFFLLMLSSQSSAQLQQAPLGMNLSGIKDWSTQLPFVDVFKSARDWIPQNVNGGSWNTGDSLTLTSKGWIARLDS